MGLGRCCFARSLRRRGSGWAGRSKRAFARGGCASREGRLVPAPSLARFFYRLRDAADILARARVREVLRALWPPARRPVVLNDLSGPEAPVRAALPGAVALDALPGAVALDALPAPGGSAAAALARLGKRLAADVFADDGRVDYARLGAADASAELAAATRVLSDRPPPDGDDAERVAFWLNLYNVLTVHGILALGIRRSVMEVPTFFSRVAYRVGGQVFTLDEIESGVLRRNRPLPASGRPPFRPGDPRLAHAPAGVDARIHGALVCAAESCPPIAFYDAARLEAQLALAGAHLAGTTTVDDQRRTLTLPSVFLWYDVDFGGPDGARAFLRAHAPAPAREALERALGAGYRLRYARHAWSLNATTK
jgi:hypothetical protein